MKRNILTIFLASPGDLQDERKIVRDSVERVNTVISRRIGWHVELLGWEDTLPSYSRPQTLINRDVDSCDLFIGILWRRWGRDTGKYSSGFEEEFIRATNRRRATGKPEIWLFFKSIDDELKNDPGNQLKKVLEFRKEQIQKKELLFKEFEDSTIWSKIIYDDLLKYVLDLTAIKPKAKYKEQSIPTEHRQDITPRIEIESSKKEKKYPSELVELFRSTSTNFNKGEPVSFNLWDATRIYLQSSVWFAEAHAGELFGNHEINLAYSRRNEWNLSNAEKWFLSRSFIGHDHDNRPGWFWLKDQKENEISRMLIWLSLEDYNENVRKNVVKLIADTGIFVKKSVLEKWIHTDDKDIVLNAVKAIKFRKKLDCFDLLNPLTSHEDSQIKDLAINTKIEIIYQSTPDDAFLYLIEVGSEVPPLIQNTIDTLDLKVKNKFLFEALEKAEPAVRLFCAKYLRKAKLLTKEKCNELFKDPDARVRKEGLLRYIELGNDVNMDFIKKLFPDPPEQKPGLAGLALQPVRADEFLPIILRKRNPDDLLSELDFFKIASIEAYKILALEHFSLIKDRIRSDLDYNFEDLKKESELRLKNQYGEASEIILKQFKDDILQYLKDKFVSAGLEGLWKNGNKSDLKYARKYINNTQLNDVDRAAIKIIEKFGDSSDVEMLLKCSSKLYGEDKRNAVEIAYRYALNKSEFINKMLNSDDSDTIDVGIKILSKSRTPKKIDIAKTLLRIKKDVTRLKGLSIIYKNRSFKELEKFLFDYTNQQTYYYNVVTWLDRCLYSRGRYRKFYRQTLRNVI